MNSFCSKNKTSSIWRGVAPIHINWFIAQSKKSKQVLVWNNILTVWIPRLKVIIYLCDCYACSLCCTVILCVSLINSCHSLPSNTCHMMVIRILGMEFSQIFSERWLKKKGATWFHCRPGFVLHLYFVIMSFENVFTPVTDWTTDSAPELCIHM